MVKYKCRDALFDQNGARPIFGFVNMRLAFPFHFQ